jgi:hypothetical protein
MQRRLGVTAFVAMTAMLCTGASSPTGCNTSGSTGSSGTYEGYAVGAAIGIGAVIAVAIIVPVEINRSHHNLTGCVFTAANGLELRTSDAKTYSLEGDAAGIKVGDKVRIHGSKIKRTKDSTGPGVFRVDQIKRNYGSCPVAPTIASAAH